LIALIGGAVPLICGDVAAVRQPISVCPCVVSGLTDPISLRPGFIATITLLIAKRPDFVSAHTGRVSLLGTLIAPIPLRQIVRDAWWLGRRALGAFAMLISHTVRSEHRPRTSSRIDETVGAGNMAATRRRLGQVRRRQWV
jgi:hypothetical protein